MKEYIRKNPFKIGAAVGVLVILGIVVSTIIRELSSSAVVHANVSVQSWGANDSGQLGSGGLSVGGNELKPSKVNTGEVKAIYGGLRHSLALTNDGRALAWGSNEFGQIGADKIGGKQIDPIEVTGLPKVTMLATRQDHNLALDEQGHVWAWGLNMSGQLGDGTNTNSAKPSMVKGIDNVQFIASGYRSSLAIKKDGSVWVWGGNCNLEKRDDSFLQRIAVLSLSGYNDGSGGTIDHITPDDNCIQEKYLNIKSYVPIKIQGLPPIKEASVGFGHTLAITSNGELWAWGCNRYGQIGTGKVGSQDENLKPIKITTIGKVTSVSAGFRHSMALDDKGQLWTWGHNYFGELGNGQHTELVFPTPSKVPGMNNITMIRAGHDYSLAVTKDKQLYGWGQASFGQLGQDEQRADKPQALQKINNAVFIAAGGAHVLTAVEQDSDK